MRIAQISDIHLSKDNLNDFKNYYLKELINDLQNFHKVEKIDLIILTGDLIDKGGEFLPEETNPFVFFVDEFINPISEALKIDKNAFLFIPGNHDIERKKVEEINELGLMAKIKNVQSANEILSANRNLFSQSNIRIQRFKDFERKYHESNPFYSYSNNESLFLYEISGKKVGFLLLNDSWRVSSETTKESHFIGIDQFLNANKYFADNNTIINIVLAHHPFSFLHSEEEEEIKNIIQRYNFELILFGHTHRTKLDKYYFLNGNSFFINSKSAFNNPREPIAIFQPGYNLIDIDLDKLDIVCHFRKYFHQRFIFDSDLEVAANGIFTSRLIPRHEKEKYYKSYDLAIKTNNSHVDDYNNSLLIYKTDSIAPKELDNLFVLPRLSEKESNFVPKNDKTFDLDDILEIKEPVLLLGKRECGKSTLLNKLSIHNSKNFSKFQKISILIDFKKLVKMDVITAIRKYLNEEAAIVKSLVLNNEILLLIDNYNQAELYEIAIKNLDKYLREYPNSKIVLTTDENIRELLEDDSSIIKKYNFKPIYIGDVGLKQFKQLANKWFKDKDDNWHEENTNKLIKFFRILRIPRTFFAVSLYLWLIEKQNNFRPKNRSFLVNKFFQFILEGLLIEESQAGSFNFERKKEVLTEIAYEMYKNGDPLEGYSLLKSQIINTIKEYFSKNQRNIDSSEVFNMFFQKGIFKTLELPLAEEDKICFRFDSFFQFFLSFNIELKPDFKDLVFSKNEILSFISELDYYSGRYQDRKDVLSVSVSLLKDSFNEIDQFITDATDNHIPNKFTLERKDYDSDEEIDDSRMTKEEVEEEHEKQLQNLPVGDSIAIKEKFDYKYRYDKSLELASRVLKNAENIQDPTLVNYCLDTILKKMTKYGIFMYALLMDDFVQSKIRGSELSKIKIPFDVLATFSPIINQGKLVDWMGTDFLEIPLKNKIEQYNSARKESHKEHYEQFLATFLYVDLKLPNYIDVLGQTVRNVDHNYFLELYFFKILFLYSKTPENSSLAPKLKEYLKLILAKTKGLNKDQANENVDNYLKEMNTDDTEDE